MPPRISAASEIDIALAAAVEGDPALAAILTEWEGEPGIFSARAPEGAGYPRIIIADSSETSRGTFGRRGNEGPTTLHIWSDVVGRIPVLVIYGHLVRLLEGQTLSLNGHSMVRCGVRLLSNLPDPAEPLQHGVVEVFTWSRNS